MKINKVLNELGLQDYLTLGYLYLIIIGIFNINIYYSSFDINIFDYITISDILLAPINMLFLNLEGSTTIILLIFFVSWLSKYIIKGINKAFEIVATKNNWNIKSFEIHPVLIFLGLFSYIFLQMSISMADGVKKNIATKTFKPTKTLTLSDNTKKNVRVIATTSSYIFYVEPGEDSVNIMPIGGNIKSIKYFE